MNPSDTTCPVAGSLDLLGDRWSLLIVRDLLPGPKRFQDLLRSVAGISPAMLSARLKRLESHGIAARETYSAHPPRADYRLTEKGRELGAIVAALAAWGSRHGTGGSSPLHHVACDHEVEVRLYCPDCETSLSPADTEFRG